MVLQDSYCCQKCGDEYASITYKWCRQCQINHLKMNWTSGNERVDDLIQETQFKINGPSDEVFEWIPYKQLDDIKKSDFSVVYSAIWKDGPLHYDHFKKIQNNLFGERGQYTRESVIKVALKYLNNSKSITDEFYDEV